MHFPVRLRWLVSFALTPGLGAFLLSSLLSSSPALAEERATLQEAHYLVFTIEGEEVRLASAQRVQLDAPLEPRPAAEVELAAAETEAVTGNSVVVRLESAAGEVLYRDIAEIPRWIRGEFHGREVRLGVNAIEPHLIEAEVRAFVVRVPMLSSAKRLVVTGARQTVFELSQLTALESALESALETTPRPIARAFTVGPAGQPANRLDLLVLGDGYTADQEDLFNADVRRIGDQFFNLSPYAEYRSFVNLHGLFTPSRESGADHPPYVSGCGGSNCCSDPAAQSDPRAGTFVSTAFDSTFCVGGIQRLLVANVTKALTAAAAVPNWDRVLMIVNDPVYGGSGGTIPVSSLHEQGIDILRHEYGHSFTRLADEYDSAYPGFPDCSDRSGSPCEANVTDETARNLVKWNPWIDASTPVPTPRGSNSLGLFEGARYRTYGMYRPRNTQCLMHFLGMPFDEVCRQEYVRQLYRGGWGQPGAGIDLIEPGSESPRPGTVTAKVGAGTRLAVDLLKPGQGSVGVTWLVDGVPAPSATGNAFTFVPPSAGTYRVELRVEDKTPFVHPDAAEGLLGTSREWTLKATSSGNAPCVASATRLCIDRAAGDRRFQVDVNYQTARDSGAAHAVPLTSLGVDRGGLFWFFAPDNPEMLVKVLDGCGVNQRFWVFYAAGTDAGLTVTVTDTATGESKVYRNPQGQAAPPVQDTSALPCDG